MRRIRTHNRNYRTGRKIKDKSVSDAYLPAPCHLSVKRKCRGLDDVYDNSAFAAIGEGASITSLGTYLSNHLSNNLTTLDLARQTGKHWTNDWHQDSWKRKVE